MVHAFCMLSGCWVSRAIVNCCVTYLKSFLKTFPTLAPGASRGVALASMGSRRRLQAEILPNPCPRLEFSFDNT
jgi:hypothetical protein